MLSLIILTDSTSEKFSEKVMLPGDRALHDWAYTEWIYFNFNDPQKGIDGTFIYCSNERMIIINNYTQGRQFVLNEAGIMAYRNDTLFFETDSSADTAVFTDSDVSIISRGKHSIFMNMGFDRAVLIEGTGRLELWDSLCFYYSYPDMRVKADISCPAYEGALNGKGWLDHQWGSFLPGADPYMWFSVMLDDGKDIMIWGFDSGIYSFMNIFSDSFARSESTLVQPVIWYTSDISGKTLPYGWYIREKSMDMEILALPGHGNYEIPEGDGTFYQGSGVIDGYLEGKPVSGRFFMEYTGGKDKKKCSCQGNCKLMYEQSVESLKGIMQNSRCDSCMVK